MDKQKIKVLWITNITFPEAHKLMGHSDEYRCSGGWMLSLASDMIETGEVSLHILSVTNEVKDLQILHGEMITYYHLPLKKKPGDYRSLMKQVNQMVNPDVVHVHGTEFPYGNAFIEACGDEKVVVSIQGVISEIAKHYHDGISVGEIYRNLTIRDVFRNTIIGDKRQFEKRGKEELATIKSVKHVIGRTTFDKAHCLAINPSVQYHIANESLRVEFYSGIWTYEKCIPHSIFLSQSSYPVKGLHQILKAMPLILNSYPDTKLRVAGGDIIHRHGLKEKLRLSGYGRYLSTLINKLSLSDKIFFTGPLDSEGMKQEYLRANVFVCPSTIENSPNSLGEAQMLGVPCVASYVGGIPDMIPNRSCGEMYRFDDVELLAWKVCDIFKRSLTFDNFEMMRVARERHDKTRNASVMLEIYKKLMTD